MSVAIVLQVILEDTDSRSLLIDFAGMFYADRSAMELGDIFHGTLVTITRRLRLLEDLRPNLETDKVRPASQQWLAWHRNEKAQR